MGVVLGPPSGAARYVTTTLKVAVALAPVFPSIASTVTVYSPVMALLETFTVKVNGGAVGETFIQADPVSKFVDRFCGTSGE